jgi:hypothetical protein
MCRITITYGLRTELFSIYTLDMTKSEIQILWMKRYISVNSIRSTSNTMGEAKHRRRDRSVEAQRPSARLHGLEQQLSRPEAGVSETNSRIGSRDRDAETRIPKEGGVSRVPRYVVVHEAGHAVLALIGCRAVSGNDGAFDFIEVRGSGDYTPIETAAAT